MYDNNELSKNPLKSRDDIFKSLEMFLLPLEEGLNDSSAYMPLGYVDGVCKNNRTHMEGLCRLLWGIGPSVSSNDEHLEWAKKIWAKLVRGMDPKDDDYYGKITDRDQYCVEMAAIGVSIALKPEFFWDTLSEVEKDNVYNWLNEINYIKMGHNNWQMFRVLVNLAFEVVGRPYEKEMHNLSLERIDSFYKGNGWYSDGLVERYDYYISFAIHFYSLIYAKVMKDKDPVRCQIYKDRAAIFAKDFIYWFSEDGSSLPFGRSLTYRMAQCAFFGALLFAEVEVDGLDIGTIKGIILRHLRQWFSKPILDLSGVLSVGYGYPNQHMAEQYNGSGSPYWAFKAFIFLALKEDHSFWLAEEKPLPKLQKSKVLKQAMMIIQRPEDSTNVIALTSGQQGAELGHCEEKYSKFAYSTGFGFNISRQNKSLLMGAYDSALVFTEDDKNSVTRDWCNEVKVTEDYIYSKWTPYKDVNVETYIIDANPWHIRLHKINAGRDLTSYEGGFTIERTKFKEQDISINEENSCIITPWGYSGIIDLLNNREQLMVEHASNCNVIFRELGCIPTLKTEIKKDKDYLLGCMVYAERDIKVAKMEWENPPKVIVGERNITISKAGKTKVIGLI